MKQFAIRAWHPKINASRYFLVESADEEIAKLLFWLDHPRWEVKNCVTAVCPAAGEHQGGLSVWIGQDSRTTILCQRHGENFPQ